MDRTLQSHSPEQTQQIAVDFSKNFTESGGIILLSGNLGAGKTTFTQGFIKAFGITQHIISPTFLLVKQYRIPNHERWIYHLDLYRLAEPINLQESGIQEILDSSDNNIILIEWAEKLGSNVPENCYSVNLENISETSRKIHLVKKVLASFFTYSLRPKGARKN